MGLMDSLGLDKVEGRPGETPVGRWDGIVASSEYVVFPNKNSYNHVITYQVTEGEKKGSRRQEVYTLGENPQFDDNKNLTSLNLTMSQDQKEWYKKRLLDLGLTDEQIAAFDSDPKDNVGKLNGTPVTFGVKEREGWLNVSFAEKRGVTAQATPEQIASAGATATAQQGSIVGTL